MKQWYCNIGGQQYGPVDEEALLDWIEEGRVVADSPVWSEGMAAWVPASTAMPEMFGDEAGPSGASGTSMVPARAPRGTGGMTLNAEIMRQARDALSGRWGLAVGFTFLLGLLSMVMQMVPYIGGLAALLCTGALELGAAIFYLTYARRGQPELGMMFKGFENFGNALGAYLLIAIFTILWMLLLIIPGIIAAISYSQTMYLLADDRNLGPLEAIGKSKEMMRGHKWRLFCLHWRFIGWALLCLLTCGVGFLWLQPYIMTSLAKFHDDLKPAPGRYDAIPDAADTFGGSAGV